MPFVGSINQDLRSLVAEVTRNWTSTDVYIGCSGNFTIERILKNRPFRLHGNDVSLYTCTIGNYLAGKTTDIRIKDPEYAWLEPYMQDELGKITTLLLCTSMLDGYGRQEPYFVRKRMAYRSQWDTLYEKTRERVTKALDGLKLVEFWPGDVVEWAERAPDDAAFITFPPTYKGGYERLYRAFDAVFEWEQPSYVIFDRERLAYLVELIKRKREWMIARDEPIEGLEEYECGRVQTSLRSRPVIVYASKATPRITMPHQKTQVLKVERLGEDDEIRPDSVLTVKKITQPQMNTLRSLYLNPGIAPAAASLNLAVLVDGKLVGAIGLSKSSQVGDAYMMTDFPIRPTRYKRLSKLILAAALSVEVKVLLEQVFNQRVRTIATTAFTDKPVSMKYRGLFDVHSRKEGRVNYIAEAGRWTLQEGLAWWMSKHALTS